MPTQRKHATFPASWCCRGSAALEPLLGEGDLLLNLSVDVASLALLRDAL